MAAGRRGAGRTGLRVDAGKNGPDAAAPLATDARGRAQCQARTRAGRGPSLAGREPGAGCFGGGLRVHRDHRHGTGAVAALAGECTHVRFGPDQFAAGVRAVDRGRRGHLQYP
ncbi:hypothetical protein G6F24_017260 [Rhizopus arrhizus]|nr:hypothetical protein G6F24_017260 [Rhizopus arrhizus]